MNENYEEAVKQLKKCWKAQGHATTAEDKAVMKSFRGFFCSGKTDYTPDVALTWLADNQLMWGDAIYQRNREVIYELNDAFVSGRIKETYDFQTTPYEMLPDELKEALRNYRDNLKNRLTFRTARNQLVHCVSFASFIGSQGVQSADGITVEIISRYHKYAESVGDAYICLYSVRYFLTFLADEGIIPKHVPYVLTSPLQAATAGYGFRHYKGSRSDYDSDGLDPEAFWKKARGFVELMKTAHHYSTDALCNNYTAYFQMLYIFNAEFSLTYTTGNTQRWVNVMSGLWDPTHQIPSIRRSFCLLDIYITTGVLTRSDIGRAFSSPGRIMDLLPEYRTIVQNLVASRLKENVSQATVDNHKSGATSFFLYLQNRGIESVSDISLQNVKEYSTWMAGQTSNHRNNYSYVIKVLLRFCYENGYISIDLARALPVQSNQQRRIVKVLTDDEIHKIYDYRENASTPIQLRDAALLMLGLFMGLRGIDAVSLKLSDINWKMKTVSITQQKTYRPLMLPMPVPVGNSVYKYIRNGRSKTSDVSDYIFLTTNVPYEKVKRSACGIAMQHALGGKTGAFHTLRRTFASRLLSVGTTTDTIKDSLGHSTMDTVNRYISTDDEGLRSCCILLDRTVMSHEADY